MQLKNFLPNKALVKKDLTRFWPVWATELVVLLLITMGEVSGLRSREYYSEYVDLGNIVMPFGYAAIFFSLVSAMMVFGYLADRKEAYLMHSFPVRRETLFWSHYFSGFLMVFVPEFLSILIFMTQLPAGLKSFPHLALVCLQVFLGIFASYNLACASMLLTANKISGIVIYAVANALACGVYLVIEFIGSFMIYSNQGGLLLTNSIYGVSMLLMAVFTPAAYFSYEVVGMKMVKPHVFVCSFVPKAFPIFWMAVPAVLFLVAGYFLYKKRAVETAGDMLAFSWAKPVYKTVFTFFFSVLFVLAFDFVRRRSLGNFDYHDRYFVGFQLIFGALLGFFVVTMIMERTFFIWKNLKWYQYVLPVAGTIFFLFFAKALGAFYLYVPEAEQVDEIRAESFYYEEDGEFNHYNGNLELIFRKPEEIQELTELNKACVKEQESLKSADYDDSFTVYYYMKDGTKLYRYYQINTETASVKNICDFFAKQKLSEHIFLEDRESIRGMEISLVDNEWNWNNVFSSEKEEPAKRIFEALKQDEAEGNPFAIHPDYDDNDKLSEKTYDVNIDINSGRRLDKRIDDETEDWRTLSFYVTQKNRHLWKVIEELVKSGKMTEEGLQQ